jgi:hypothetical protein
MGLRGPGCQRNKTPLEPGCPYYKPPPVKSSCTVAYATKQGGFVTGPEANGLGSGAADVCAPWVKSDVDFKLATCEASIMLTPRKALTSDDVYCETKRLAREAAGELGVSTVLSSDAGY